ncbi:tyrosine phosphatase [Aspergillus sclerotioniger CBS 115572]|uniref:diphosphoinositol-polyphosphate diphosphatase n=1 Tax=Aspergillus sclerotioniger CBS 115572 TaxID=1450535 RepID=A0A317X9X8_9EURO|nr:tyrosine phosphatase [Aspergillus sclerotioniger CBS 115572]PWY93718.1 tyrosine phosphatase [Aspergillus sclerotioniger CBS 115572]
MANPLTEKDSNSSLKSVHVARHKASSIESEPAQSELPDNFGEVVKGVYRSAFPHPWNLHALKKLGLKNIITLVDEAYTSSHVVFLKENGIAHHRILVQANKDPDVKIPDTVMCRILELLLDKSNHPILIHCNKGKHRTGCVVGCFRKLQGWESRDIIDEYFHHSYPKSRLLDEKFINEFDASQLSQSAQASGVKAWKPSGHFKLPSEENDKASPTRLLPPVL